MGLATVVVPDHRSASNDHWGKITPFANASVHDSSRRVKPTKSSPRLIPMAEGEGRIPIRFSATGIEAAEWSLRSRASHEIRANQLTLNSNL